MDTCCKDDSERRALIRAMASIDRVLPLFGSSYSEQESMAMAIRDYWTESPTLPSSRYVRRLLQRYIAVLEDSPSPSGVESDTLMALLLDLPKIKSQAPSPTEFFYLSFFDDPPLHIRIFPYHNDVSLRLWEAGASLAEFIVQNFQDYVQGKRVVELGAGVGLTGLIAAGPCKAQEVLMTDYTTECLDNLSHNLTANKRWLEHYTGKVSMGYLDWGSFVALYNPHENESMEREDKETIHAFQNAELLLAADVAYDLSVLKNLVGVIKTFLTVPNKRALFAITRRNMETFHILLGHLETHKIHCQWIVSGEGGCTELPHLFPCNFAQPRSDVWIALLSA